MGSSYSVLRIGRILRRWEDEVPAFLTFLFDPGDLNWKNDPEEPELFLELGYETTCARALENLNRYGFSLEYCVEVYQFLYDYVCSHSADAVKYQIRRLSPTKLADADVARQYSLYLEAYSHLSLQAELNAFVDFVRTITVVDPGIPPLDKPYVLGNYEHSESGSSQKDNDRASELRSISAIEYFSLRRRSDGKQTVDIDWEQLTEYLISNYRSFPPSVLSLALIFSSQHWFIHEYPDVISLIFLYIIAKASDPATIIRLELSDILDSVDQARAIQVTLAETLIAKIRLYNLTFAALFRDEADMRELYVKSEGSRLLADCDTAATTYEKGRSLEILMEMIFSVNGSLDVSGKRVTTGDEEIDLVIKNDINRPFWQAFTSPLFFVECKNWETPVDARQLRDFAEKIQDHGNLVKLGFLVSLGGFTREAKCALKRIGRKDDYILVLIDRGDIEEYLTSSIDIFTWLERMATKLY